MDLQNTALQQDYSPPYNNNQINASQSSNSPRLQNVLVNSPHQNDNKLNKLTIALVVLLASIGIVLGTKLWITREQIPSEEPVQNAAEENTNEVPTNTIDTKNWKLYTDPSKDFTLRYPPSYYLLSDDSSTIQDTKFIQLSKNSEQELPIIAISIEPAGGYLDTYLTNKAYYEDAKKKDELYRSMDNQETDIFPGKSEQQYEEITVDGYATYLVSTRFLDPFSTVTSAAFLRNNLTYKFTLITEDVADLKNCNEIINTFKFTDYRQSNMGKLLSFSRLSS